MRGTKSSRISDHVYVYCINVREYGKVYQNGQSRETGNTGSTTRRQTKQKYNTICVRHHYVQDKDKQNKNTTQYVLDITMYKTKTNKTKIQHNMC